MAGCAMGLAVMRLMAGGWLSTGGVCYMPSTCRAPLFPHAPQRTQAAVNRIQWGIGVALVLDDIPFRAADSFAGVKESGPVGVVLAMIGSKAG